MGGLLGGLLGGGSFSGGGIGSSANQTTNTTDNKNNATSGDNSNVYDTRGGSLTYNITDGGIAEKAFGTVGDATKQAFGFGNDAFDFAAGAYRGVFDFATQVNNRAAENLQEGTVKILDKVTIDSGQRIQAVTETFGKYAIYAGLAIAAIMVLKK